MTTTSTFHTNSNDVYVLVCLIALDLFFSELDDEYPEGRKKPLMQSDLGQSNSLHTKRTKLGYPSSSHSLSLLDCREQLSFPVKTEFGLSCAVMFLLICNRTRTARKD